MTQKGVSEGEEVNKDLIVGIPSYNEADTISFVVEQVDKGLIKYFPDLKCQIVNVDNNSPDNTKQAFLNTNTTTEKVYISTRPGVKGKGRNFYNLFKHAKEHNTKAVIVVDADLKSITPEWVKKLGEPALNQTDFVSPLYLRHKHDGQITNNVVFPLVYSLLNRYIRQPIGGDFAVSSRLVNYYLEQEWTESTKEYGIDIFMTMHALLGDFSTKQVLLGQKIHKPSTPKLNQMFTEVINSLFSVLIANQEKIKNITDNVKPKIDLFLSELDVEGPKVDINEIKDTSIKEYEEKKSFIQKVLQDTTFRKVDEAFSNGVYIDHSLWADVVFESLNSYKKNEDPLEVVEAFKPMYWATIHTFIKQASKFTSYEAEKIILDRADTFYEKRSKFLEN